MNLFKPNFWDKNQISIYSILFFPVSLLIKALSILRRCIIKKNKASIPVICVGNIYLGGTGKTPLCVEVFSILKNLNMNPAFIRKEYKSFQDEINLLKKTGSVFQSKSRIEAIKDAIINGANIAILDDGFQDFSIKKNLSIVCFNEKQWIGNGLTIPSGPLRESLSELKRADIVVVNGEKNKEIEHKIFEKNKKIKIFYSKYKPENINEIEKKKVIAFAGIGNPGNFFNLLRENDINIVEEIKFSDHHKYSKKEMKNLISKSNKDNAILLTTEKDYFRIDNDEKKYIKFLKVKVKIDTRDKFIEEIKKFI